MRIEIHPETKEEKKDFQKKIYENVYEFALTGSYLEAKVKPSSFNHTQGDTIVLFGKLEELKERLRAFHDANPKRR